MAGYVRLESWNSSTADPGINQVSIWDLRERVPIVTTVDADVNCWIEKIINNTGVPTQPDFSNYKFAQTTFFNRALAEQWVDGYGGVVYVDVFSRDIVGMVRLLTFKP